MNRELSNKLLDKRLSPAAPSTAMYVVMFEVVQTVSAQAVGRRPTLTSDRHPSRQPRRSARQPLPAQQPVLGTQNDLGYDTVSAPRVIEQMTNARTSNVTDQGALT